MEQRVSAILDSPVPGRPEPRSNVSKAQSSTETKSFNMRSTSTDVATVAEDKEEALAGATMKEGDLGMTIETEEAIDVDIDHVRRRHDAEGIQGRGHRRGHRHGLMA